MYFEIILFSLVAVCAAVILICKYVIKMVPAESTEAIYIAQHEQEPWYLDYARSFFPVLLIVFLLRGFIAEPFRIPSGSMLPTLEVGDFILVNKFSYGIRLPILHTKVLPVSSPKRGDIMVFRFPGDGKTNYIKRVIGLPGDTIKYTHKRLTVNGKPIDVVEDGTYTPFPMRGRPRALGKYKQTIATQKSEDEFLEYSILLEKRSSSPNREWTVPEGKYFVLGDNRDHSLDSRFWNFVPEENVVGRAFFIWFHWNSHPKGGVDLSRIGEDI